MSRKHFNILLLAAGIGLVAIGYVLSPAFVGTRVLGRSALESSFVLKMAALQLAAVTAGAAALFIGVVRISRKLAQVLLVPLAVGYFFLGHAVFLNVLYPKNVFLKPAALKKSWDALTGRELFLSDFQPKSTLKVENRQVLKAKFPVIDAHFHFASLKHMTVDELVQAMDACGIEKIVNLDGWPEIYDKFKSEFVDRYPNRFIMFAQMQLWRVDRANFIKDQIDYLERMAARGARGIKEVKSFGLGYRGNSQHLIPIDDPRLAPVWEKLGELKLPVLMHTADPAPFFAPVDRFNERFEELAMYPEWSFYGPRYPTRETLFKQRENLIRRHPGTTFIGAHMGCNEDDLKYVGYMLDTYPNYYVDISARLNELGRQPFTAREFFLKYQDRILFATDGGYQTGTREWPAQKLYSTYFEFLETHNENFDYPLWDVQKQGRWRIHGLHLPDEVLEKIYYKNAEKLLRLNQP
jgi:predicted TIM-barrel fold metal-dependent hydrolase